MLQARRTRLRAEERGQHSLGELWLRDGADHMAAVSHGRAALGEQKVIAVARLHVGDLGQECVDILWVKPAGCQAIIQQAVAPGIARLFGTDIVPEAAEPGEGAAQTIAA
jgi:hypothetical protein